MEFRIVADMALMSTGEWNQENFLQWVALRNLDLKIKCPTKAGTKIITACHISSKAYAEAVF